MAERKQYQVWIYGKLHDMERVMWSLHMDYPVWQDAADNYCYWVRTRGTDNVMLTEDISPKIEVKVLKEEK